MGQYLAHAHQRAAALGGLDQVAGSLALVDSRLALQDGNGRLPRQPVGRAERVFSLGPWSDVDAVVEPFGQLDGRQHGALPPRGELVSDPQLLVQAAGVDAVFAVLGREEQVEVIDSRLIFAGGGG